jgi:hypothetical protein
MKPALLAASLVLASCAAMRGDATGGGSANGGGANGGGANGGGANGGGANGGGATGGGSSTADAGCTGDAGTYDRLIACDGPVAFWAMNQTTTEPDLTGNGNSGSYRGGAPVLVALPNGDQAADFDGASQYLTIPSNATLSIPTRGVLTWEAWLRPDVLQFPNANGGFVSWMGKCATYSPTCEWEGRMYTATNAQNRCDRLSAYAFNSTAGLGSGADWQPICTLFQAGQWLHVVGEYSTSLQMTPAVCTNTAQYPGSLNIWVNGVEWDQSRHGQTGCMSQYSVIPTAHDSPLNIGSMAGDSWFKGAIGKVAIYGYLLTPAQIAAHYHAMTGLMPTGSCSDTCSF